jgi:hypothetical protein
MVRQMRVILISVLAVVENFSVPDLDMLGMVDGVMLTQ